MDQASACLLICSINRLLSPSLLLKWWKADPSLSFKTDPHPIHTITSGKIKAAALKTQIEKEYDKLQEQLSDYQRRGIKVIPITSHQYPSWLKTIYDPPPVLFAKGNENLLIKGRKIGVVGREILPHMAKKQFFILQKSLQATSGSLSADSRPE